VITWWKLLLCAVCVVDRSNVVCLYISNSDFYTVKYNTIGDMSSFLPRDAYA